MSCLWVQNLNNRTSVFLVRTKWKTLPCVPAWQNRVFFVPEQLRPSSLRVL